MPQRICCVSSCAASLIEGAKLHAFPNPEKEPEKFRVWVVNAGLLGEEESYIFKNKRICHTHFEETYHYPKNRLSKLAFPTLHLSGSGAAANSDKNANGENKEVQDQANSSSGHEVQDKAVSNKDHASSRNEEYNAKDYLKKREEYFKKLGGSTQSPKAEGVSLDISELEPDDTQTEEETVAEEETVPEDVVFSWQQSEQIVVEDDADSTNDNSTSVAENETQNLTGANLGMTKKTNDDVVKIVDIETEKSEYLCDHCTKEIVGFRYACVQCENLDLCHDCEMKLVHPHHYMLRVPPRKTFSEVKSVLGEIREKLKLLHADDKNDCSLDLEDIKLEEPEFAEVVVDPLLDALPTDPMPEQDVHDDEIHMLFRDSPPRTTVCDEREDPPNVPDVDTHDNIQREVPTTLSRKQYYRKRKSTRDDQRQEDTKKSVVENSPAKNKRGKTILTYLDKKRSSNIRKDFYQKKLEDGKTNFDVEKHRGTLSDEQREEINSEAQEYLDEMWLDESILDSESDVLLSHEQQGTELESKETSDRKDEDTSMKLRQTKTIKVVKLKQVSS